jgi:hypothetical protein
MKIPSGKQTRRSACPDLPVNLRSEIKGSRKPNFRLEEDDRLSNAEYAKERGITTRQASKQRRGY